MLKRIGTAARRDSRRSSASRCSCSSACRCAATGEGRPRAPRVRIPADVLMARERSAAVVIGQLPAGGERPRGDASSRATSARSAASRKRRPAHALAVRRTPSSSSRSASSCSSTPGRSDLVRVDHFDVTQPFAALREDLGAAGRRRRGWWSVVARTHRRARPAARTVTGCWSGRCGRWRWPRRPARVAVVLRRPLPGSLGHRPRLDRCVACGRAYPFPRPALGEGGLVCEACARARRRRRAGFAGDIGGLRAAAERYAGKKRWPRRSAEAELALLELRSRAHRPSDTSRAQPGSAAGSISGSVIADGCLR